MTNIDLTGQQVQGYTLVRKVGSGGFGTVYLGKKEELGKIYKTAIKHISLPDADAYEAALQDYGYDKAAVQNHFEEMVRDITAEINTLLELSKKDNRYIVAYYDHEIQRFDDPLQFEIFMRMEYLMPFTRQIRQKGMTIGDIVKLGLHMSNALSLCHVNGVIHRDIKEANIFINEGGNYKLGDFGVAKTAIDSTQAGSIKGTISYMAPEVYLREPYDTSVDIYSLGIVLYKLLNNQRLPFMPPAPMPYTVDDKNLADAKRLRGEVPPLPANANNKLGEIVVKACSAKGIRYRDAVDLRKDLQDFLEEIPWEEYNRIVVPPTAEDTEDVDSFSENMLVSYSQKQHSSSVQNRSGQGPSIPNPYEEKPKKKIGKWIALAALAAVVVIAGYIFVSALTDPLKKFKTAIAENDFVKAEQLYQDKLKDGRSSRLAKAEKFVVSQAEEIRAKYYAGEIDYEDALDQLQEMDELGVVDTWEIRDVIEQVDDMRTSQEAYKSAQKNMKREKYNEAIDDFNKVMKEDPHYADAQSQIAEAIKIYKKDINASLAELEKDKQYDEAIAVLNQGLLLVPDDADFLKKMEEYEEKIEETNTLEIDRIIREAKSAASVAGAYETALSNLREALEQYPNHEELESAISEVEGDYVKKVLEEAKNLSNAGMYQKAEKLLNDALKLVPSSSELISAASRY